MEYVLSSEWSSSTVPFASLSLSLAPGNKPQILNPFSGHSTYETVPYRALCIFSLICTIQPGFTFQSLYKCGVVVFFLTHSSRVCSYIHKQICINAQCVHKACALQYMKMRNKMRENENKNSFPWWSRSIFSSSFFFKKKKKELDFVCYIHIINVTTTLNLYLL